MIQLEEALAKIGFETGSHVINAINDDILFESRGVHQHSKLKGAKTAAVDFLGEKVAISSLQGFSDNYSVPIRLIINPATNEDFVIGDSSKKEFINVYLDPVDGTIKLAGLGSMPGKLRLVCDGSWGFGMALTRPTNAPLSELKISDFVYGTLVDGNPPTYTSHPRNAFSTLNDGRISTYEVFPEAKLRITPGPRGLVDLLTSSQTIISQGIGGFDGFQAFDRKSAPPGTEALATEVYRRLSNRNEGGFFEFGWRIYGDFGDILRNHLGYQKYEPIGVARITLNQNLPNIVPIYSVYKGAGGIVTDFSGNDIGERRLIDGRTNVIMSANPAIHEKVLDKLKGL